MAKILIISGNLKDWTKNSGGKERTATLAEALIDHDVTFLSFSWDGPYFTKKLENGINHIQPQIESIAIKKYRQMISTKVKNNYDAALELVKPDMKNFSQHVKKLSSESDVVIIDHYSVSPFIEDISDTVPVIYSSHNAEIVMATQLYPDDIDTINLVRTMESRAINRANALVYCSKKDFSELEGIYKKINGHYIPNGTVMQELTDPKVRMGSKNILFVGSGHLPNVIAAKRLIHLAQVMPSYSFIICGGAGNGINKNLIPSNLHIMGHVSDEDLHILFENSFAFINPMESGSGTHLKMMKALSYGIPIITSDIGARGFSDEEISNCMIIANTTGEMVSAINKLNDEKTFTEISNSGYKLSNEYDWEKIKIDYEAVVKKYINEKPVEKVLDIIENKKSILIYSIIRNREEWMGKYHSQLRAAVEASPEYDFYLSIYENDSTDKTRQEILNKNWSFVKGFSFISENLNTKYFSSVKDAQRVENLSNARNKGIEGGNFLDKVDYVMMIEGDVKYDIASFRRLLNFENIEPNFDIVSTISLRKNGTHYDWWATRTTPIFVKERSEIETDYSKKEYGRYYSTSNGLCLYRAKPFQEGIRHHWINSATGEFDCEMVVLCQKFHEKGYSNIFIDYKAIAYHI